MARVYGSLERHGRYPVDHRQQLLAGYRPGPAALGCLQRDELRIHGGLHRAGSSCHQAAALILCGVYLRRAAAATVYAIHLCTAVFDAAFHADGPVSYTHLTLP